MSDIIAVAGLTAAAFAATNLDNLLLLVALFGDRSFRSRDILLGYGSAAVLVAAVAYIMAKGVELAPAGYLGLLGLVPLAMGLARLRDLFRTDFAPVDRPSRLGAGVLPVALLMLAQSTDSFGVYISVFADTQALLEIPVLLTLMFCVVTWCAVARWLARASGIAVPLQRLSRFVVPVLLIVIGLYILLDTTTDVGPIVGVPGI